MKACKYGCAQELEWDTANSRFKEKDGTLHSKERCAYLKSLLPKQAAPAPAKAEPYDTQYNRELENAQGAKQGHLENVAMHKERLDNDRKLIEAITENTRQQKENSIILDQIRMHCEVLAKGETARSSFQVAGSVKK